MIKVSYEIDGEETYLLVTKSHLFLLTSGGLKRADKLVPWHEETQQGDKLMLADGGETPVTGLHVGYFKKGIHHIATTDHPALSLEGHLLNSNGVVTADYALQLAQEDTINAVSFAMTMEDVDDELPTFGTREYIEKYPHVVAGDFHAYPSPTEVSFSLEEAVETKADIPGIFDAFGRGPISIPDDAQYFISQAQADDIFTYHYDKIDTPASSAAMPAVRYLFAIYKGFYPQVEFRLDWEEPKPNAASFIHLDVPFIIINGGLARTEGVNFEMLAFVIAHELGHLYGGEPKTQTGKYSCTGQSDYGGIMGVMTSVWYGKYYRQILQDAMKQLETFFGYISEDKRKGTPGDTCLDISIECRKAAMTAAMCTYPLPECAGGPKQPNLEVTSAEASQDDKVTVVTVSFNEAVNPDTAEDADDYKLAPDGTVTSAKVDKQDDSKVNLQVEIQPNVEYTLRVKDVLSANDNPLVSRKSTATFILKCKQKE